jgi:hypothetical protein
LIVEVDLTRLPKLQDESGSQQLQDEKKRLLAQNKGCVNEAALKMTKKYVKADGNCLFNCATLAIQNTVENP